ncbi:hypothetical protein NDU88_002734 [Pleurodeles waltl]|uniref:Uncharacterized protein n=1 Tax=Pleurodeles waltl TaxID=8319 RepID=A0AAV7PEW4_PLEWA|nr:hypothetical protein NDU88_002734 [Pleurodeles waltl]
MALTALSVLFIVEMPFGKTTGKCMHQLLNSDAISPPPTMAPPAVTLSPNPTGAFVDTHPDTAMERILQEITAVGHRLEAINSKIMDLSTNSKPIRADRAGFQDKVTDLDHCLNADSSLAGQ